MGKFITKILFLLILFIFLSFHVSMTQNHVPQSITQIAVNHDDVSKNLKVDLDYGKIPLYFIPNEGQVNEKALFYAKASRYTLWLTREGLVFDSARTTGKKGTGSRRTDPRDRTGPGHYRCERDVSRIKFLNANKASEVIPVDETEHRVNYFIGNDETEWRVNIWTSRAVLYKGVYRDIDLKVYGIEKEIKYDWVIKPGGDIEEILFEYSGVKGTGIDGEGNLVVLTEFGEIVHRKPESYQIIAGEMIEVEVEFSEKGANVYGFEPGSYSKDHELVIDPMVLGYATYLGGDDRDYGFDIDVDSSGNAYVTGYTRSTDFPIQNAYMGDPVDYKYDVFVTKLSSGGNSLVYSTYIGGNGHDSGRGIAVGSDGSAYVTGNTLSTDFPTLNAYMGDPGDSENDVFVTKLSVTGDSLVYSTYIGGNGYDYGYGIAVNKTGSAYVTGTTFSTDYPVLNAYMTDPGDNSDDVFVTKLSAAGNSLVYSTYIGGSDEDEAYGIVVDGIGCAYITGETLSLDFPTENPYMTDPGDDLADAFVAKLSAAGNSLVYSSYIGGNDYDYGRDIAVDSAGSAYVTGTTFSTDFPTLNAYMTDPGDNSDDVFVTKLSAAGNSLVYSTYLGGDDLDDGRGIAVDSAGIAYLTGGTFSTNFPTENPYMIDPGDRINDVFVTKLSSTGNSLAYSTYLGGNDGDYGQGIAVDSFGNTYITGGTDSTDFPVLNEYMTDPGDGDMDAFVARLSHTDKDDILGTWSTGVWYKNTDTGSWVKMTTPAVLVAAGDIDGDGTDDLIGVWSSGLWLKYSSSKSWAKLSVTLPTDITSGDMNGDGRDDILGSWASGVWYRNTDTGSWVKMTTPAQMVAAGDIDGDNTDDLIGEWSSGLWVKYSSTSSWLLITPSLPTCIASGDMNGDGRDDILGTWPSGVWYRNSSGGSWVKMSTPSNLVAAGDIDGDGTDDLIGTWSSGLWVKNSSTTSWQFICTSLPIDIDAGLFRTGWGAGAVSYETAIVGVYAEGPGNIDDYKDLTSEGPGGWNFVFLEEANLIPQEKGMNIMRVPGPGEPGFTYIDQKNLAPQENIIKNKKLIQ